MCSTIWNKLQDPNKVKGNVKHFTVSCIQGTIKHTHHQNVLTEPRELPLALK